MPLAFVIATVLATNFQLTCCNSISLDVKLLNSNRIKINDSVDIECSVKRTNDFSVLWSFSRRTINQSVDEKPKDISENCVSFEAATYSVICDEPGLTLHRKFVLRIKRVKWSDRGYYYCKIANSAKNIFLNVIDPKLIFTMASDKPMSGLGTLKSPYLPEAGSGFEFACQTKCTEITPAPLHLGFKRLDRTAVSPPPEFVPQRRAPAWWLSDQLSADSTVSSDYHVLDHSLATKTARCSDRNAPENYAAVTVHFRVENCSTLGLDGRTMFTCFPSARGSTPPRQIFIKCPVIYRNFPLTHGKIVAASVGSVLGLVFIAIGFAIFCPCRSDKSDDKSRDLRPVAV